MFTFLRIVLRNLLRHRLRSFLTALGIVVAIMAFSLLRTVVDAWYAGVEATSATRLVTRNAISLVFGLPLSYLYKIRQIDGVVAVSYSNWFGGVYQSEKNFFPQFAIEPRSYLALYPEFLLTEQELLAFLRDRNGAVAGSKLAARFGWQVGDPIPLRGTIYPGNWSFMLRGIYRGARPSTDETQFFFHWEKLNETMKKTAPGEADDEVGVYIVGVEHAARTAEVSQAIDQLFHNSLAETLTETEKAFQIGFVSMTEAILMAIRVVSLVVIVIIMAVMANTMAMTARERRREYATLKALGFAPLSIAGLIFGESLLLAVAAGTLGIALTYPAAEWFAAQVSALLPVFVISRETVGMAAGASVIVGLVAAVVPAWQAMRIPVADALRSVG